MIQNEIRREQGVSTYRREARLRLNAAVCRSWHVTCGVRVPTPGEGEAEGKRKGNGVAVRRGGEGQPAGQQAAACLQQRSAAQWQLQRESTGR